MKPVLLSEKAADDLWDAVDFYELQEPGAGDLLFAALVREMRRLERSHGHHRIRHGFHKLTTARFPHAIYYWEMADEVVVMAIVDERRDPETIRKELSRRPPDGG
jgi:plasmid stabilization system protein ParE